MTRSFFAAAAAFAILAGAGAGTAHAQQRLVISAKGLDLASPKDAKTFYDRLRREVTIACGGEPTYMLVTEQPRFDACFKAAMDQAVPQVDAPLVTAIHEGKTARATALASR